MPTPAIQYNLSLFIEIISVCGRYMNYEWHLRHSSHIVVSRSLPQVHGQLARLGGFGIETEASQLLPPKYCADCRLKVV